MGKLAKGVVMLSKVIFYIAECARMAPRIARELAEEERKGLKDRQCFSERARVMHKVLMSVAIRCFIDRNRVKSAKALMRNKEAMAIISETLFANYAVFFSSRPS